MRFPRLPHLLLLTSSFVLSFTYTNLAHCSFTSTTAVLLAFARPFLARGVEAAGVPQSEHVARRDSTYVQVFGGTGEPAEGWPTMNDWIPTFEEM